MNRPIHFEIFSSAPEQSAQFYRKVFGWELSKWEGPEEYWLVRTGEGSPGIDGGVARRRFSQAVINTIGVKSVTEALKAVEAAGGKGVFGPYEIPGVGLHAYCSDPDGTLFGILESPMS